METVLISELQEAADRAAKGIRDPEEMRQVCEDMDRIRADVARRLGTVEIAVDLIRAARSEG